MARSGEGELREELSTFGLSDTEIDTYLTLLSRGEATTSAVSEDADVTQRAVYNIAERLESRGLVRVNDHASPTTIRALPPDEAIGNLTERLESIAPDLEERFDESEPQAPEIRIVKSRSTALKRLRRAIDAAEHEAMVAVPAAVYPEIRTELVEAVDRGVLVFLLVGDLTNPRGIADGVGEAATLARYWSESLPLLFAVDDRSAMNGNSELLSGTHGDAQASVVSEDHLAGAVIGSFLGAYWPVAEELHVADRGSLPATFDWFRTASLQAILHRQAGVDLHAEVRTEGGATVSGPVLDVRQALIEPETNEFTLENTIVVDAAEGPVSVGGPGSFIEDYRADVVTLSRAE